MQKASFCVLGCQGVGAEVAKCLVMTGCQVSVCDPEPVSFMDLCSNPFFTEQDIGRPRDVVLARQLSDLNPHTTTSQITISDLNQFSQYQAVIYTYSSLFSTLQVGSFCRSRQIHFIISQTFGLSGRIFTDFGQDFTIYDEFGEWIETFSVRELSIDLQQQEILLYEYNPTLYDGAIVELTGVKVSIKVNDEIQIKQQSKLEKLINNRRFRVKTASKWNNSLHFGEENAELLQYLHDMERLGAKVEFTRGGYVRQIKEAKTIHFRSFEDALKEPTYSESMCDFVKLLERNIFFEVYKYLDYHPGALQQCTIPWSESQFEHFYEELASNTQVECLRSELAKNIIRKFIGLHMGQFSPVCSVVGGWGAQEALKAVSGVYTPIQQFWLFDCFEVLKTMPTQEDTSPQNCRYDGQIAIFGKKIQEMIHDQSVLLVGAGALGCELTKFLALSGACTQNELTVVDFDRVRNSNLPHQFLFRDGDAGLMKAEVACKKAQSMNPETKINPILAKLSKDNNSNPELWQNKSIVLSAVDSFESRHVIDSKCVQHHKPLIDSGTSGPKSNMQVIIPYCTKHYSATSDPEGGEAPASTIHNFPSNITHCIVYATSEFKGMFESAVEDLLKWQGTNTDQEIAQFGNDLQSDLAALKGRFSNLLQLVHNKIENEEDCYRFAFSQFKRFFQKMIRRLLGINPLDSKNLDGSPFWSANKRPPKVLQFDESNEFHMMFIKNAAKIVSDVFNIKFEFNKEKVHQILEKIDEIEVFTADEANVLVDQYVSKNAFLLPKLLKSHFRFRPKKSTKVSAVAFEKDDPTNGHIAFLSAFSNLRAQNYGIPQADNNEIRRIAGNIIPAMITTTAAIVGHVGIEFMKLVQQFDKMEDFKQVFMNFALPMIQISENEECVKYKFGSTDKTFTIWDFIDMRGDVTIQEVLDEALKVTGIPIDGIMIGAQSIYMGFMDGPEKKQLKIREILKSYGEPYSGEILLALMPEGDGNVPNLRLRD